MTVTFQSYRITLVAVAELKYLGRVLKDSDEDWPAVVGNLRKVQKQWVGMLKILGWERAYPHISGNFYKAVVQVTLLFSAESWVMSPRIGRTLGGFHHRVVFCM